MNSVTKNFMKKLLCKDDFNSFLMNSNKNYILSKRKYRNIYVFFKNKNVIVLDKRHKITNVYNNIKTVVQNLKF